MKPIRTFFSENLWRDNCSPSWHSSSGNGNKATTSRKRFREYIDLIWHERASRMWEREGRRVSEFLASIPRWIVILFTEWEMPWKEHIWAVGEGRGKLNFDLIVLCLQCVQVTQIKIKFLQLKLPKTFTTHILKIQSLNLY